MSLAVPKTETPASNYDQLLCIGGSKNGKLVRIPRYSRGYEVALPPVRCYEYVASAYVPFENIEYETYQRRQITEATQVLASVGMNPRQIVDMAFELLASRVQEKSDR